MPLLFSLCYLKEMSEDKTSAELSGEAKGKPESSEATVSDVVPDRDYLLKLFAHLANFYGVSFSVTLSVGGLLISGSIISVEEYMGSLVGSIRQGTSDWPPDAKNFLEGDFLEPILQVSGKFKEDEIEALKNTSYIHLKGARVFHAAGKPIPSSDDGFLWRGRISSVDGFSMGQLSYSVSYSQGTPKL